MCQNISNSCGDNIVAPAGQDGILTTLVDNEECDLGLLNGQPNSGCSKTCKFTHWYQPTGNNIENVTSYTEPDIGVLIGHPQSQNPTLDCVIEAVPQPLFVPFNLPTLFTTYEFSQTCSWEVAGADICPAPNTEYWNIAEQELLWTGWDNNGNNIPPLHPLREAFRDFNVNNVYNLSTNAGVDPNTPDLVWINDSLPNLDVQVEERQGVLHEHASVLIELKPSLWTELPPGGDELLESLAVSKE